MDENHFVESLLDGHRKYQLIQFTEPISVLKKAIEIVDHSNKSIVKNVLKIVVTKEKPNHCFD
ncbi:hypothetical protein BpHYR1_018984 [Brachionus plicatilis]|uniref:Uncharacterized protein n=1 Tax=Brachionus plicatilis TaxID=10195 RepID=A0A3M7PI96_BRAPC|nr:hypothetical protein BpHYR1_018984 [Brachionus plicatilis]